MTKSLLRKAFEEARRDELKSQLKQAKQVKTIHTSESTEGKSQTTTIVWLYADPGRSIFERPRMVQSEVNTIYYNKEGEVVRRTLHVYDYSGDCIASEDTITHQDRQLKMLNEMF